MKRLSIVILSLAILSGCQTYRASMRYGQGFEYNAHMHNLQEIPEARITAMSKKGAYAFASYGTTDNSAGGQESWTGHEYAAGLGYEHRWDDIAAYLEAGWYHIEQDDISIRESDRHAFKHVYGKDVPAFQNYENPISDAIGIAFGGRYYVTDTVSVGAGIHLRAHEARWKADTTEEDPDRWWTWSYMHNCSRVYAEIAWDFWTK